jgi:predicted metal-binding membrane protein
MTSTTTDHARRLVVAPGSGVRVSRAALLVVAAGAWVGTILWDRATGNGPGTMGMGPGRFIAMWVLMMTAMMLPSVVGALRASDVTPSERPAVEGRDGAGRTLAFAAGYLLVWAATGLPAFGLAVVAGRLAAHHPAAATSCAVVILALCGLYQFSPMKNRALDHCRLLPTLGATVPAAGRNGTRYCVWCLACSWGAMTLMITFGVMNIAATVVLALVIYAERFWFKGRAISRLAGVAALVCGVVVVFSPSLAAGLHQMPSMYQMPPM